MGATLLPEALRKLRSVEKESIGPFGTVAITPGEADALLDALDLLVRIRADDECGDTQQTVRSETWALICEAADAVEASR